MRKRTWLPLTWVMIGSLLTFVSPAGSGSTESSTKDRPMRWPSSAPGPYADSTQNKAAHRGTAELRAAPARNSQIGIRWLGHASYLLTTSAGTTIITDPIKFKGYSPPEGITADIVTVSHEHIDHNCVEAIAGNPTVLRGTDRKCHEVYPVDTVIGDVRIVSVPSFHDPGHRASNAIFVFEFDSVRVVHLGDIGEVMTDEQIDAIGQCDVLMIPVGGQYTVGLARADSIVNQLNVQHFVLPMHYKTEAFDDFPYGVEQFLAGKDNVRRVEDTVFVFNPSDRSARREYVVMRY